MTEIDAEWILARLPTTRGAKKKLAEAIDVAPNKLTKILTGERRVQQIEAVKIAAYFGETLTADPAQAEMRDLWRQLTDDERRFLTNAAKAQIAARVQK